MASILDKLQLGSAAANSYAAPVAEAPIADAAAPEAQKMGLLSRIIQAVAPTVGSPLWAALNNPNGIYGTNTALRADPQQQQQIADAAQKRQQDLRTGGLALHDAEMADEFGSFQPLGNEIVNIMPGGGVKSVYKTAPQATETERLVDRWVKAKNEGRADEADVLERAIKGYQYTDGYQDSIFRRKQALKRTTPGKAPSSAGSGGIPALPPGLKLKV